MRAGLYNLSVLKNPFLFGWQMKESFDENKQNSST